MQTRFPDHDQGNTGYRCFFLVGLRKSRTDTTERTGTVVLKRTYTIDPQQQTLTPALEPFPIFLQDVPDNLVRNGNFEEELFDGDGQPVHWQPESDGVTIKRVVDPSDPEKMNHLLEVTGVPKGRVVQTIEFGEPLDCQSFSVSFLARTAAADSSIEGVQLEAGNGNSICSISADLKTEEQLFAGAGKWEKDLNATSMRLALCMTHDGVNPVLYDDVQIYNSLLYEHDLASIKPNGDVIVLGYTPSAGDLAAQVQVDGKVWLKRVLRANDRHHLFGWASRIEGERRKRAGVFPDKREDYPLKQLPDEFDNCYFNGSRDAVQPALPYIPVAAAIAIHQQEGAEPYCFRLHGDTATASYFYYSGEGTDKAENWESCDVTMNVDTLVIEPDRNRCYVVWRGVWPFDEHPEDVYRHLEVRAAA